MRQGVMMKEKVTLADLAAPKQRISRETSSTSVKVSGSQGQAGVLALYFPGYSSVLKGS
jgi:hypothetical protein